MSIKEADKVHDTLLKSQQDLLASIRNAYSSCNEAVLSRLELVPDDTLSLCKKYFEWEFEDNFLPLIVGCVHDEVSFTVRNALQTTFQMFARSAASAASAFEEAEESPRFRRRKPEPSTHTAPEEVEEQPPEEAAAAQTPPLLWRRSLSHHQTLSEGNLAKNLPRFCRRPYNRQFMLTKGCGVNQRHLCVGACQQPYTIKVTSSGTT